LPVLPARQGYFFFLTFPELEEREEVREDVEREDLDRELELIFFEVVPFDELREELLLMYLLLLFPEM